MTSAHADPIRSSAQAMPVTTLGSTIHLQVRAFTIVDFETYLHRLTADLAILDI
jgi:hypothetical protein